MQTLGKSSLKSLWLKLSVLAVLATASGPAHAVCGIAFVDPVTQQKASVIDYYALNCVRAAVYNALFDNLLVKIPDCNNAYRCRFYALDPLTDNEWVYQGLF